MATSGFSGMLWSPEVRSCENPRDLLRRVETVVFSAQALLNCWRIPNPPWKQVDVEKNLNGEKMEGSEFYTQVCVRYLNLRMSLLPYLYSAFVLYQREGIPPIRAVVLDYPLDSRAAVIDDQYLFGESLMVCPLTLEDKTSRKVYLPEGKWYDFFTREILEGGMEYQRKADYDQIPVFVKAGSLIPMAEPVACVKEDTVFKIHVRTYGISAASFTLYEDDFLTFSNETERKFVVIRSDENGSLSWERSGNESIRYEFQEGGFL
jgi:alpha-D-xyloside xylohydrolase